MSDGCVVVELRRNNVHVMQRYEELVNVHYKEPVNGLSDDGTTSVLKALVCFDVFKNDYVFYLLLIM